MHVLLEKLLVSLTNVETSLTKVQKSSLMVTYEVNAVGPILVIKVPFLLIFEIYRNII